MNQHHWAKTGLAAVLIGTLLVGCTANGTTPTTATETPTTTATEPATTTSNPILIQTVPKTTVVTAPTTVVDVSPVIQSTDLMKNIKEKSAAEKEVDETFFNAYLNFSLNFFKEANKTNNENVLVSPLSVQLLMGMLANGDNGQTQKEIETALGLPTSQINAYFRNYVGGLPSAEKYKVSVANAIWFNDYLSGTIKRDFLQTNANYYDASLYQGDFDEQTRKEMNAWVEENTDGLLKDAIDTLSPQDLMVLINTVLFDGEWQNPYGKDHVYTTTFTTASGQERTVKMMAEVETVRAINMEDAVGFSKPFKDGYYSFVAVLPDASVPLDSYVSTLTVEKLKTMLNCESMKVRIGIPKFSVNYEADMNRILPSMGITALFSSGFNNISSSKLSVDEIIHKTAIEVDETGTKAAAVTAVKLKYASGFSVVLNRPFVYMIVDNTTNLPIFVGTVTDIGT